MSAERSCRSCRRATRPRRRRGSTNAASSSATCPAPAGHAPPAAGGRTRTTSTASSAASTRKRHRFVTREVQTRHVLRRRLSVGWWDPSTRVYLLRLLLFGQRCEQVDHRAVGVLHLGVALAPEGVPRLLVRRAAGIEELAVEAVHLVRRAAVECAAVRMAAARPLPVWVEGAHGLLAVEHVAQSARELCFDVAVALLVRLGQVEAELAVERECARHVAD